MEKWQTTRYFKIKSEFLGKGKKTYADGESYDGDWIEGKKEGLGTYRWADGSIYVGELKNDKKHGTSNSSLNFLGKGKETYADGESYQGEWI